MDKANKKPINLTPHDIAVFSSRSPSAPSTPACSTIFKRGSFVARLISEDQIEFTELSNIIGVPVFSRPVYTHATGLPEDKTTNIIVSMIVAKYLISGSGKWKGMVFAPDSGPKSVVRNEDGRVIGVSRLICYQCPQ